MMMNRLFVWKQIGFHYSDACCEVQEWRGRLEIVIAGEFLKMAASPLRNNCFTTDCFSTGALFSNKTSVHLVFFPVYPFSHVLFELFFSCLVWVREWVSWMKLQSSEYMFLYCCRSPVFPEDLIFEKRQLFWT